MAQYIRLTIGESAPYFKQRSMHNPRYSFDTAAGRYLVLCFFGKARDKLAIEALQGVHKYPNLFNDDHASFFGITYDDNDFTKPNLKEFYPGYRYFLDEEGIIGKLYGALPLDAKIATLKQKWVVIDPGMRIKQVFDFSRNSSKVEEVIRYLSTLPPPFLNSGIPIQAPVLILNDILDTQLCQTLINYFHTNEQTDSGYMIQKGNKTISKKNYSHKRRTDCTIKEKTLIHLIKRSIEKKLLPQLKKAFMFEATHIERYLIGCYDSQDSGHFNPHRDNTTSGTMHRKFAVSISLNDDFQSEGIIFPEYSPKGIRVPTGSAVVFSCALLHKVAPIKKGKRYALIPFLYDHNGETIRQTNLHTLQ